MFIPVYKPDLRGNELRYITKCVKSQWISSIGEYVTAFEKRFAKWCGSKYGVSTCNGTTALHLALAVLDIKKGDEVIVPALTFVATANVVKYTGAKPVFVDICEDTWCIDPEKIKKVITKKTKAIIPVHLYGHPCDMDAIMKIARKYNLYVIEDAAEAHGAAYKGKKVGAIGHMGCFSFYGNKVMTTGEGGMVLTNNKKLYEKLQFFKDHGMSKTKRYYHPVVGYNYRMTNLQAAIGCAQLEKVDGFIKRKRQVASLYNNLLKNIEGIQLPVEKENCRNVYWMYSIIVNNKFGTNRDTLIKKLLSKSIDSRPFFYPLHKLPPYRTGKYFPVAEMVSQTGINLPSFPGLTDSRIGRIVNTIKDISKG